jgi:hypothetical protein
MFAGEVFDGMETLLAARGLVAEASKRGTSLTWDVSSEAGQATEDDRNAIVEWAHDRRDVTETDVGPLGDLREDDE